MKSTALEVSASAQCTGWAGAPLRSTLALLAWPSALLGAMLAFDVQLPPVALYGFAACFALAVLFKSVSDPEWALALLIIYMPLSRQYVVPLAPGVNGTNMTWLLVLLAWAMEVRRRGGNVFVPTAAARPVRWWMALSGLSFVTTFITEGLDPLMDASSHLRGWADSLLCFFAVSNPKFLPSR
jgi:hypothetical protein